MFLIAENPNLALPVIIFLLAFFLAIHLTGFLRRVAMRWAVHDAPSARKTQSAPVPLLGGPAIALAVALALVLAWALSQDLRPEYTRHLWTILAVGAGIAAVGLLDDIVGVRAALKLLAVAAGCAVLFLDGVGLVRTGWPFADYLLTFLWVAGVSSSFNAIDNSDGLAGGVAFSSALVLFLVGWTTWQLPFSFLAMALAGGVLGFLHYNAPPARIYMGDCGSFFLGYTLAVLIILAEWSDNALRSFLSGALFVALPVYDLGLTSLLRLRHGIVSGIGEVLSYSDRDHLAHRLRALGLTHGQMLAALYGLNLLFCAVGFAVIHAPWPLAAALLCGAAGTAAGLGWFLDRKTSRPGLWVNRAGGGA